VPGGGSVVGVSTARRTQAERSSETIGRLVDATIEAIAEVGYHRASLGEVCSRSGVSKGGLFRHFDSRLDLVVAAAGEVARRHVAAFEQLRANSATPTPEQLLEFTRGATRERANSVWFELLVAARTEPELRERLAPLAHDLYAYIEQAASQVFGGTVPDDVITLLATSVVHMFDGEAILRHTYPRPELEDARLAMTAQLVRQVAQRW
jgi:AcrR family transcriptional regulator